MTSAKRSAINQFSDRSQCCLVVQVSGGALARTSSVAPSIKDRSKLRGNRVDTIFRAGPQPFSFFFETFAFETRRKLHHVSPQLDALDTTAAANPAALES